MVSKLFIALAVFAVLKSSSATTTIKTTPGVKSSSATTTLKATPGVKSSSATTTLKAAPGAPSAAAGPAASNKQTTTPMPLLCKTGNCSGIEECINYLKDTNCSGVCVKAVENKNATYGDYALTCNKAYNTCDNFNKANKATTPVPYCCATSLCTKYIPPQNSASNISAISANFIIAVFASFLKKYLL